MRLERELARSKQDVIDLRAEQLLAGRQLARARRDLREVDRAFRDAVEGGATSEALRLSARGARLDDRVLRLQGRSAEHRAALISALASHRRLEREQEVLREPQGGWGPAPQIA